MSCVYKSQDLGSQGSNHILFLLKLFETQCLDKCQSPRKHSVLVEQVNACLLQRFILMALMMGGVEHSRHTKVVIISVDMCLHYFIFYFRVREYNQWRKIGGKGERES